MTKITGNQEPLESETLYMYPSTYGEQTLSQSLAIGVVKPEYVSFISARTYAQQSSIFFQWFFTEEEIDYLIEGLQEAKQRMHDKEYLKRMQELTEDELILYDK